jgi:DNA-binding NtrC family response regulator
MAEDKRILVVEDDERVRDALSNLLEAWGYSVERASDGNQGWEKIVSGRPVVVISDLRMPGLGGLELLKQTRDFNLAAHFIMLTGYGTIQDAVEATKLGAFNFLTKPIDPARLQIELRNCLDRNESERQLQIAHRRLRDLGALGKLVGRSKKMQEVMSVITMVAPSAASVLITGESGTGKELAARTIHELSPYRNSSFVAVNCAAIPESLIESELFGHEKGAFTGAIQQRMGCFELAQGGTLLLDEIGEMPAMAQAKLLRVLEDSKVRRLGGVSEVQVAVRVLASTNKVPEEAVKSGQLRSDLFYRLNVVQISLPPLREHLEDLESLATALLADLSRRHQRIVQMIDADALELMRRYSWPGNVRELRNTLERAVVTCSGNVITSRDLPPLLRGKVERMPQEQLRIVPGLSVAEVERRHILETLASTHHNKTKAAAILGITLKTLHNKLKQYAASSPETLNCKEGLETRA